MREYIVYILKSVWYQKTYVGFTSNLIQRFNAHNKQATKGCTKRYRPWVVIYVSFFKTKNEALKKEKLLKSSKGREWIKYTGLRKNSLATKLGFVNSGIFNHIQSGRNGISPNLARKICGMYPEISENWLLSVNGVMLYPKHSTVDNEAIGQ